MHQCISHHFSHVERSSHIFPSPPKLSAGMDSPADSFTDIEEFQVGKFTPSVACWPAVGVCAGRQLPILWPGFCCVLGSSTTSNRSKPLRSVRSWSPPLCLRCFPSRGMRISRAVCSSQSDRTELPELRILLADVAWAVDPVCFGSSAMVLVGVRLCGLPLGERAASCG